MRIIMAALAAAVFGVAPAQAQFDSAEQVKPILKMIKPQWVSLREYEGQDLLYFTMLEVYRCGIDQIRYVINEGKPAVWETPPCEGDEAFSDIPADRLPFTTFPLKSVEKLRIELTYDDGTVEWAEYQRGDVLQ
ncbi:hypothetical protein [Psychromarinibacter halotolerans]|uniref:Uncharacterized protein n=1 Tax=Psychromarinibacter halotolerans TaxID=1775175 RepID=A0ABV7GZ60_9RHOB|nr:hypothetical protein [Psychromarinibacter halotolerans]MAQ82109.1 hypothetical protein [Maritimibacter sp.]MDF0598067.1 hypothetical protein [Psychromarinibacter halotolerans]